MVIWLRSPRGGIGIGQDLVRADDWAQLIELDRALAAAERQAEELVAAARHDADAIRRDAEENAERMLQAAQDEYDNAEQRGYEAGHERALREAHDAMLRNAASERELLASQRQRLADIVMRTVARVLGDADRDSLFAQVAVTLSRSLDEVSFLAVRVAPADLEEATRAFRRVCDAHRWPVNPEVSADPDAQPGSCVCEWDHGVIEAGLPMQLRALEQAIGAALRKEADGAAGDPACASPAGVSMNVVPAEDAFDDESAFDDAFEHDDA